MKNQQVDTNATKSLLAKSERKIKKGKVLSEII